MAFLHSDLGAAVGWLDLRIEFVQKQTGTLFLRELARLLEELEQDVRFAPHIATIAAGAERLVAELRASDTRLTAAAVELRHELVRLAPSCDDSRKEPASSDGPAGPNWQFTLAGFDRRVSEIQPHPPFAFGDKIETKAADLLSTLELKQDALKTQSTNSAGVTDWLQRLARLRMEFQRAMVSFNNGRFTDPGVSLVFARNELFGALDPVGLSLEAPFPTRHGFSTAYAAGRHLWSGIQVEPQPDSDVGRQIEQVGDSLRPHLDRIHLALRSRIGSRASLVALIDRFKHRCEWHDRSRLLALTKSSPKKQEEVLTEELARWLFDAGMNPVSTPMMAGRRPDVVDPTAPFNLYIEAKQYSKGAKTYLLKGFRQAWDAVAALQSTPYRVSEGFLVIFRLGGPLYTFPDFVDGPGCTLYIRVVDISGAASHGSKNPPKPIRVEVKDLLGAQRTGRRARGGAKATSFKGRKAPKSTRFRE